MAAPPSPPSDSAPSKAPLPEDEKERLDTLRSYRILDTPSEQAYDDITYLASQICDTPIAVVSLVDSERQWFKSAYGLDLKETSRDIAFCAHAILHPDSLFIVEDASLDERFFNNPLVTADPPIRFYAGAPLVAAGGMALGTLCVIDQKPRQMSQAQQKTLAALSRQVVAQLELRRSMADLQQSSKELSRSHAALKLRNAQLNKSHDEMSDLVALLQSQADVINRDLQRAEIIQRSLLPHDVPDLGDFNVRTLYRPGNTVGGDLYDAVVIDEKHLALVVADAAGHGVSAAMLSVLFKNEIHLQDASTGVPYRPGWALSRINTSLCTNQPAPGVFLTAAYCLLDIKERKLTIASAGHPPVVWLHADGSVDQIGHTGAALGLDADATYEEHELTLQPNDRVLLYTDGLLDIGKTTQTIQSIATTLHDLTDHPDVLEDLLVQVTGGTIRADCDDVTLVMLSASAGLSEFRESSGTFDVAEAVEEEQPEIAYLDTIETTFLTLTGRITWLYGQILFDTANGAIEADHNLVIDLAHCDYMDSTILGTLHELSVNAVSQKRHIQIQNVSPALRASFEELSMTVVMKHIASVPEQVPEGLTPLDLSMSQLERQQQRLLKAHEALSALSQENQAQFESLLETLRSEMDES